ncbi:MAG: fatty acid desaturase [Polyangiaceae bacterium]|nr:fatty acid desaturase [Polyangiaceae bacterium]
MGAPPIDADTLAALARPRAAPWLAAAACDWAIIAGTFGLVAWIDHPAAYALAVVPLGSRQQALGALFHDAAHGLVTRRRRANDALGSLLAAWPLGLTLGGYRRYHFAHHRALGTDADPEIGHKRALPEWSLPARPWSVVAAFGSDLVGGGVAHLAAAGALTRPTRAWEALAMTATWALAAALAWRAGALWVPLLWTASIVTVFWSGVRLRIFTEHLGAQDTHRIVVPAWLAHLIMPHDIGLHWEHHHFPDVPFWNLARLRAALPASEVVPAPLPLGRLLAAFGASEPLASGQIAEVVSREGRPVAAPPRATYAARRDLPYLRHVAWPLVAGLTVYVTCRDTLPRALAWMPWKAAWITRVPERVADVFPDVAWAYALTATFALAWPSPGLARRAWLFAAVALIVGWELGQRAGWLPGTWDAWDLGLGVAAWAAAVLSCRARPTEESHR